MHGKSVPMLVNEKQKRYVLDTHVITLLLFYAYDPLVTGYNAIVFGDLPTSTTPLLMASINYTDWITLKLRSFICAALRCNVLYFVFG